MIDLSEIVLVNLIKHSGIEMWPYIITYLNVIEIVSLEYVDTTLAVNKKQLLLIQETTWVCWDLGMQRWVYIL